LKFYIKKEEDKWKPFNGILFHKSGPANKQHTNQPTLMVYLVIQKIVTEKNVSRMFILRKMVKS
jgi:hypothetical protein